MLLLVAFKFPGTFTVHKKDTGNVHSIQWSMRGALPFLNYIKNHVIVKHELVLKAIALAELHKSDYSKILIKMKD